MGSFLSDIPTMVRTGAVRFDWAFLNLSPPDKHGMYTGTFLHRIYKPPSLPPPLPLMTGFCSLGTEVCVALPAAQHARKLVAQINPNVPRVHGNSFIHWDALDYVVDVARDDPDAAVPEDEHVGAEPNDAALRIGMRVCGCL